MRLRIWQQNLNKSNKAQFDLINTPLHKEWDVLLLQEPYIDSFGNTKATSRWHVLYLSSHLANSSTCRSVILVNSSLDTNAWAQVPLEGSNDLTVIQFWLPQGRLTVFNVYNDCTHQNTLTMIWLFMQRHSASLLASENDRMMWCGDFNWHHPLWDEEWNSHLFTSGTSSAAQPLIDMLEDYNMVMLLPKGIPTLQSMAMKNWTRVDNVFTTQNTENSMVICDTDPRQPGPGTDHVPVLTTLDLDVPTAAIKSRRNYRAMEWPKFREELVEQLAAIPGPGVLIDETQYQKAVNNLTAALQTAIEWAVPLSKTSPHSHHWWTEDLSQLKEEMNHLGGTSYRYHAIAEHVSHSQYTKVWNEYGLAIK